MQYVVDRKNPALLTNEVDQRKLFFYMMKQPEKEQIAYFRAIYDSHGVHVSNLQGFQSAYNSVLEKQSSGCIMPHESCDPSMTDCERTNGCRCCRIAPYGVGGSGGIGHCERGASDTCE